MQAQHSTATVGAVTWTDKHGRPLESRLTVQRFNPSREELREIEAQAVRICRITYRIAR